MTDAALLHGGVSELPWFGAVYIKVGVMRALCIFEGNGSYVKTFSLQ